MVVAVTDPAAGKRGVTAFILDTATPGYKVLRVENKLGQHTAHTAQIQLDNVRMPVGQCAGRRSVAAMR
jgi:alkylation response protein AidB-like acyl-CoA dehydrogenase